MDYVKKMGKFIPVKITDNKFADKLLDGEVFMRPLYEFGSWGRLEVKDRKELANSFRGDLAEGCVEAIGDPKNHYFFKGVQEKALLEHMKNACAIDMGDILFFKIFSMYCLEFDEKGNSFLKPDERLKNFGDTAVLILDYCEFIRRLKTAALKKYKNIAFLNDKVDFFNFQSNKTIIPLFNKSNDYSYQKELRIAISELETKGHKNDRLNCVSYDMVKTLNRELFQLGDIRDIAIKIPVNDFLDLNITKDIEIEWSTNNNLHVITPFEREVIKTRFQMSKYEPSTWTFMFSI